MSNKIAIITKSPHHKPIYDRVIAENHYEIGVHLAVTTAEYLEIAKSCIAAGTKVIIATQQLRDLVKKEWPTSNIVYIPVRRTPFSFAYRLQEVLRSEDRVAVFARSYEGAYRGAVLNAISMFPGRTIFKEVTEESDFEQIAHELFGEKISTILGPTWVFPYLSDFDFQMLTFPLSDVDVRETLVQAFLHLKTLEDSEKSANLLGTILNNTSNGVIAFSSTGNILQINQKALQDLHISPRTVCTPEEEKILFESLGVREIFQTGQMHSNFLAMVFGYSFISTAEPVFLDDQPEIGVVTLTPVMEIQDNEAKIRQKALGKGNLAAKTFSSIIGNSTAMQQAIREAERYAAVDSTVLITAPTGCGKEIFAQSMHNASSRRAHPFVVINCAALPESILESLLFGYVKGAFTGAQNEGKAGLFEIAHGGTIFIDEISELPFSLQSRFLRVLQEREVMRIGSDHAIPIDVRVIAATNKNLQVMAEAGRFREDLYYRINVLTLQIPPLAERKEDIPDLARYFIQMRSKSLDLSVTDIAADAAAYLAQLDYPGNVRQLNNILERAMVLSDSDLISLDTIRLAFQPAQSVKYTPTSVGGPLRAVPLRSSQLTKEIIEQALKDAAYNQTAAAAALHISTTTLWRKMKIFHISND